MKPAKLIRDVNAGRGGLSPEAVKAAVVSLLEDLGEAEPQRWHVQEAFERAARIESSLAKEPQAATTEVKLQPLFGIREILTSDRVSEALEPKVLKLRNELFGSERIPFRSWRAAEKWLKSTFEEERITASQGRASDQKYGKRARELQRLSGGAEVHLRRRTLLYPAKNRGKVLLRSVAAFAGGKLNKLACVVESLSTRSGFQPVAVTWWVLVGLRPLLPRMRVFERERGDGFGYVTLEINSRDLGWRELWKAYGKLRALPSMERPKANPLHYRILQLVKKSGGVPATGKTKFWEEIRLQLVRDKAAPRVPKTWQAIRKAYLEKRVGVKASGSSS